MFINVSTRLFVYNFSPNDFPILYNINWHRKQVSGTAAPLFILVIDCGDSGSWKSCKANPVNLDYLHEAVYSILCKTRSISSSNQAHIHTSVRKKQQKRYWKTSTTGIPFFLYALDAFNAEEIWNLVKNLLIDFEICLSFWFACVIDTQQPITLYMSIN